MKFFLIFAFFTIFQISFAQYSVPIQDKEKGLSDADFLYAKEGYLKMSYSDIYVAHRKAIVSLFNKLGSVNNYDFLRTDEDFSKWVSENLSSTKFKNVEEAIELRKLSLSLNDKMLKEYHEVFDLLSRATVAQGVEILKPDRFTETELQH